MNAGNDTQMLEGSGAPSNSDHSQAQKPRRRQVATACIRCRKRKIRCNGSFPCEPCLRLRLACQEPEVKRNSSRASLERRIEQLEALAAGAGAGLESGFSEQPILAGRHRSQSSASLYSNLSLPLSLDTSLGSLAPRIGDYASSNISETSPVYAAHIPTIEVTASSRTQSPDPFGFQLPDLPTPASYSPDPATTPVLSTGSLSMPPSPASSQPWMEPWRFPQEYEFNTRVASPFSLDQDHFTHSRSGSFSSNAWGGLDNSAIGGSVKDDYNPYLHNQTANLADASGQSYVCPTSIGGPLHPSDGFMVGERIHQIENSGDPSILPADELQGFVARGYSSNQGQTFGFNEHNTNLFSSAFFKYIQPLYPFLDQDRHFEYLALSKSRQPFESSLVGIPPTKAAFQIYIVQAIGAQVLEHQKGVPRYFRDSYFSAATQSHNSFNKLESIHDIEAALLLLIYAIYSGAPGIDVCLLKSTVIASCIQLGFHKPSSGIDVTLLSYRGLLALLSAYVLDRTISIALDIPFAVCDSNIEIESLIAQLQASSPRNDNYPVDVATIGTVAKVSRLTSIIYTVQKFSSRTHPRLATPFLGEASPNALSNWRSEIFHTLEMLSTQFRNQKENQDRAQGKAELNTDIMRNLVELRIQETTLLLLHPSKQAFTLSPFEKRTVISTSRATIAIYQQLQASKELFPSISAARSIYICGEILLLLLPADNRATDPDIKTCHALLQLFSEVDIAKQLGRSFDELQRTDRNCS